MTGNRLAREIAQDEALREVGWVARAARELHQLEQRDGDGWSPEYVLAAAEYFARKRDLLAHIAASPLSTPTFRPSMVVDAERLRDEFAEQLDPAAAGVLEARLAGPR